MSKLPLLCQTPTYNRICKCKCFIQLCLTSTLMLNKQNDVNQNRTFEYFNTKFHRDRWKQKQPFTFWYCVNNFYPWKDIVGKKVSNLRSIVPGASQRFSAILSLVLFYAVHLSSTENINKRSPGAPASSYFCQNEILYSERENGLLSNCFYIFYRPLFFVFTVRQKIFPPCNSKTLYVMFTDSRQESLKPKSEMTRFHFCWGVKKVFFIWFEWTQPPHATHCLASCLGSADAHWSA